MKGNMGKRIMRAISKESTPPCSQLLSLCSSLWTNQREVIRGKGELILHTRATALTTPKWH